MIDRLAHVTLYVRDQDEALGWYTEKLGFVKRADDDSIPGFRWLTIAPHNQQEVEILLLEPDDEELASRIGKVSHWVLETADCYEAYEVMTARGVKFLAPPEEQPWGVQAIFEDLYGNQFVLLEPR